MTGLTRDNQAEILRVDEVSDDWNRCCCAPYHPLRLEVRQYIPVPGDSVSSDWSHLTQDFFKDFGGLTGGRKQQKLKEMYREQPPLISMVSNPLVLSNQNIQLTRFCRFKLVKIFQYPKQL